MTPKRDPKTIKNRRKNNCGSKGSPLEPPGEPRDTNQGCQNEPPGSPKLRFWVQKRSKKGHSDALSETHTKVKKYNNSVLICRSRGLESHHRGVRVSPLEHPWNERNEWYHAATPHTTTHTKPPPHHPHCNPPTPLSFEFRGRRQRAEPIIYIYIYIYIDLLFRHLIIS